MPPAPARFSTTTTWPIAFPSCGEMMRAVMSATPPGGNGTIQRTVLPDCAQAPAQRAADAASAMQRESPRGLGAGMAILCVGAALRVDDLLELAERPHAGQHLCHGRVGLALLLDRLD